jgi:putative flippase GtrA
MSLPSIRTRLSSSWRLLAKELSAFGVVGGVCFVLDVGLFQLLYGHLGVNPVTAKLISTLVATTAAYFGNRHWTFSHRARTGLRREYLLFAAVNGVTLALGLVVVWLVSGPLEQDSSLVLQLANIGSIALGTILRFICYRRWVFLATDEAPDRDGPAAAVRRAA